MSVQPFARREYSATAADTTLATGLAPDALSFTISADGTGFPTGARGPFLMVIDPDTSTEEKIMCLSRAGSAFVVPLGGRGWEGTTNQNHDIGAKARHCLGTTDLDEANLVVSMTLRLIAGRGTILVGSAPNTLVALAPGTDGLALVYDSSVAAGIKAAAPLPAAHDHSSNTLGGNIPQASVIGLPAALNGKLSLAGGTMTGALVLSGDGAAALNPASKQQLDAEVTARGVAEGLLVPKAGTTMTGLLVLSGDAVVALGAATKQQTVMKAGDTMTGPLVLSGDPAVALGAATKQYVDALKPGPVWSIPTLGTNIIDFDASTYFGPRYWKDALGFVHMRGLGKANGVVAANAVLLTLPAGFRPGIRMMFSSPSSGTTTAAFIQANAAGFTRMDVLPDGTVVMASTGLVSNDWFSVSPITFYAEN